MNLVRLILVEMRQKSNSNTLNTVFNKQSIYLLFNCGLRKSSDTEVFKYQIQSILHYV